jgi:anti-sigma factor RsiW
MTRDELEFSISQYLDGGLAEEDQAALEALLATDAEARALLADYRRVDLALKSRPLPAVDWDALAGHICAAVADRAEEPAVSYRIGGFRTMAALALAACVVVGIGLGIRLLQPSQSNPTGGALALKPAKPPVEIVVVDSRPAAPAPSTAPVAAIAVGPSSQLQDRPGFAGYHDDVISRSAEVLVARGGGAGHDVSFLP